MELKRLLNSKFPFLDMTILMFSKIFTPRQNEIMTLRIVDTMYLLYLNSLPRKYKSSIIYMYTTIHNVTTRMFDPQDG